MTGLTTAPGARGHVLIRRQVLDVAVHGSQADGLAVQQRLSGLCATLVAPALEAALGPAASEPAHRYLERLTLDLGEVPLDGLEAALAERIRQEIDEYLRRQRPTGRPSVQELLETHHADDVPAFVSVATVDEALVAFLRTGRLPWTFTLPTGQGLEAVVRQAWSGGDRDAASAPPAGLRRRLADLLGEPSARARLVMQFSAEFVAAVLRSVAPEHAEAAEAAIAELATGPGRGGSAANRAIWLAAATAAAAGQGLPVTALLLAAFPGAAAATNARPPAPTRPSAAGRAASSQPLPGNHRAAPTADAPAHPDRSAGAGAAETLLAPTQAPEVINAAALAASAAFTDDVAGGILVDHAGVVLLHPFLERFFAGLDLVGTDRLVDPGRALLLVHHLATGARQAPEHELTLAKALCGVALEQPVDADVAVTDSETEEATALLEAVIGHWTALRGTSPTALRAEFFDRPGLLSVDADSDWLLRIETRTVDILLDDLPWGLALVRLPWMDRMMKIEWR